MVQPRLKRAFAVFSAAAFVISMLASAPAAVASNRVNDGDPDQPPMGHPVPPKRYLHMREHQLALYRGFPFKLPYNARQVAINQMVQQRQTLAQRGLPGPDTTPAWTPIGPAPIPNGQVAGFATNIPVSGRVTAIVVDPLNANLVYVGTAQGGVYRTSDASAATPTWTPLMDNADSLAVGALALDPLDHTKLFVGTGEGNFSLDSFAGVGMYRIIGANSGSGTLQGPFELKVAGTGTTAGGGHAFASESITAIAIDPNDDSNMFLGTSLGFSGTSGAQKPGAAPIGLYFSDNAQATTPHFSRVSGIPGSPNSTVSDVMFAPGSSSVLLVGVGDLAGTNSGLYRSSNAGTATIGTSGVSPTFTRVVNTSPNIFNIKLTANKISTTTTMLAGIENTSGGRLIKSIDGGQTWPTTLAGAAGYCGGQCYYDIAVAIDPGTVNNVYVGGSADGSGPTTQFERSTDGSTFNVSDANLHADTHAIAVAPSDASVIYTGNDGGIFRSADHGATWTSINTPGFSATQFESIAVHPTNAKFSIGGTQDNGTPMRDGTGAWNRVDYGDGGFSAIDQNATNTTDVTMYHTYFNQHNNLIGYATVDHVADAFDGNWAFRGCLGTTGNGISCGDHTLFYAPLALGPGNPNTVYFGTDRLYRSSDKGANNTVVSQGPIDSGTLTNGSPIVVSAIGISAQDDNVRIVGLNNGDVWRTTTGSSTLVKVTGGWPAGIYIARVVIDPTARNTAYVTLDGFTGGTTAALSHIWKTTNLGNATPTWTSRGSGLPDIPVNAFVVDPGNHLHLFAGTDIGVYESSDAGTSWHPFGTGLPVVAVFDMAVASPGTGTEVLRVATHGKGMWQAPIAAASDSTPPTAHMTKPSSTYTPTKSVPLAWTGTDTGGSGLKNYDVRYRRAKYNTSTFGSYSPVILATTLTAKTFAASPGFTYCFSVRARDNNLNLGAYSAEACTMIPVDDHAMGHSTGWTLANVAGDYLGTISRSSTHGKTMTLASVHGKQVGVLVTVCSGCGAITFNFAGKTFAASLNNTTTAHFIYFTPAGAYTGIKTGTVTIKITSANGHLVQIDGLVTIIRGSIIATSSSDQAARLQ